MGYKSSKKFRMWFGVSLIWGAFLLTISGCGSQADVSISDFVHRSPSTEVAVGQEIGLAVTVSNPGNLPLTYQWTVNGGGTVMPLSDADPFPRFQAPSEAGNVTVAVAVIHRGAILDQRDLQLTIVKSTTAGAETQQPTAPTADSGVSPKQVPTTEATPVAGRPDWCEFGRPPILGSA